MADNANTNTTTATEAKAKQPKRLGEADLLKRHSHMIEGTLSYVRPDGTCDNTDVPTDLCITHPNKQVCKIRTRGIDGQPDGNTRWIATSDLHQCFWTADTKKAMDKAKRNANAKANRALVKAAKAQAAATVEA